MTRRATWSASTVALLALVGAGAARPAVAAERGTDDPAADESRASGRADTAVAETSEVVAPQVDGAAERLAEVFGDDAELSGFLEESLQFREAMGLRAEAEDVLQLLVDSGEDSTISMGYLTPLRAEEVAKVDRQMEIQTRLSFARPEIETRVGERFAGVWIDHRAAALVTISVRSGGPLPSADVVADLLPAGTEVRVQPAERSLKDLEGLRQTLDPRVEQLRGEGLEIVSVGPSETTNTVRVGVVADDLAEATERLADLAPAVEVEASEPIGLLTGENDTAAVHNRTKYPLTSGDRITNPYKICTAGPYVYKNGTNALRVLTAGHCLQPPGGPLSTAPWRDVGESATFGTPTQAYYFDGAGADAGLTSVTAGVRGSGNCVYESANSCRTYGGAANPNEDDVNIASGSTTGIDFGTVREINADVVFNGVHLNNLTRTNNVSRPGDSGGPSYHKAGTNGSKAIFHGVTSGGGLNGSELMYFSPFGNIMPVLGVHF
jgi:hypothetical protein